MVGAFDRKVERGGFPRIRGIFPGAGGPGGKPQEKVTVALGANSAYIGSGLACSIRVPLLARPWV
jgi:hypothetical protein